jgi:hypothetical protein
MKNYEEVQQFLRDSTRVGSQIASDHGAKNIEITIGYRIDDLPPSFASGVGQTTEALILINRVEFEPQKRPLRRTRKFTVFNPDTGKEIWPGAQMDLDGDSCFFQLHVGNVTNQGWGVAASWRNNNLQKVFHQITNLIDECSTKTFQNYSTLPIIKCESFHW